MDYVKKFLNVEGIIGQGTFGKVLVTSLIQNQTYSQHSSPKQTTINNYQSSPPIRVLSPQQPTNPIATLQLSSATAVSPNSNSASSATIVAVSPEPNAFGCNENGTAPKTRFALKCIHPIIKPQRLVSELRFLRDLGGKNNVVQMHSAYFQDGALFIVMDLIEHDRFVDIVPYLNYEEIWSYVKNLMIALEWVHSKDIVHRDIKPANFLFNRKHRKFLLVDFGLAQKTKPAGLFGSSATKSSLDPNTFSKTKYGNGVGGALSRSIVRQAGEVANASSPMTMPLIRPSSHLNNHGNTTPNSKLDQRSMVIPNSPYVNPRQMQSPAKRLINFSSANVPATPNISTKRSLQPNETNDSIQMLKKLRVSNNDDPKEPVKLTVGAYESPVTHDESTARSTRHQISQDNHKFSTPKVPRRYANAKCDCQGKPKTCGNCMSKPESNVSRSGTPGYKAPEILLRSSFQTTAIDIWSAGVIMICLLSGHSPMFRDTDDTNSLAEMINIFGTDRMIQAAWNMGVRLDSKPRYPGYPVKYICQQTRYHMKNGDIRIPDCAYDLLKLMLEPNPLIRISASGALSHPWLSTPIEQHKGLQSTPFRSV